MEDLMSIDDLKRLIKTDSTSDFRVVMDKISVDHPETRKLDPEQIDVRLPLVMYLFIVRDAEGKECPAGVPCHIIRHRGEDTEKGFAVDLAIQTGAEGIFQTLHNVSVICPAGLKFDMPGIECVLVEYVNWEKIVKLVEDGPEQPKQTVRPRPQLSLVVNNVDTVESLIEPPSIEVDQDKLVELLRQHVSTTYMPSAKTTHYRHHVAQAVKAVDDGDFLRILLDQEQSGFFYRDALRRGETYVALVMRQEVFVIGLKSLFAVFANKTLGRVTDMGAKTFILDREQLMKTLQNL